MICRDCGKEMELVDQDPLLGKMWHCTTCNLTYILAGPGNAFDRTGWKYN